MRWTTRSDRRAACRRVFFGFGDGTLSFFPPDATILGDLRLPLGTRGLGHFTPAYGRRLDDNGGIVEKGGASGLTRSPCFRTVLCGYDGCMARDTGAPCR